MAVDAGNVTAGVQAPTKECDVIMKGGITSGVVYPLAMVELSDQYRFANVGGTSAGAIAAAVTAAAEYGRATGGFNRIAEIPAELGSNLVKLFQPSPSVKPLFDILIATLGKPTPGSVKRTRFSAILSTVESFDRILTAIVKGYRSAAIAGALPGLTLFIIAALSGYVGWAAFGLLALLVGLFLALGYRLYVAVTRDLKANNYGLCTGATQDEKGYGHLAVTEWLSDTIDECAGLKKKGEKGSVPLTFGHLKKPLGGKAINLAMMTTNLSMRRPYRIPFRDRAYLYREADIRSLLPGRVAEFMVAKSQIYIGSEKDDPNDPSDEELKAKQVEDFRYLPPEDDFPVIFAARLSLSFPLLFTAIPLYTRDFTLRDRDAKMAPRRCYFSDGGISNNFPIQFFDALWPNAPTFAIGLDDFNPERNDEKRRVWMPQGINQNRVTTSGALLPVEAIDGLSGFLASILYAAKDWQDNLQSTQHGYRERIVHVALKSDEGGLNLTMPKEVIEALSGYGRDAGVALRTDFDFDEHRWRRFLVAMSRLENTLFDLQGAYDGEEATEPFAEFLKRYPPAAKAYAPTPEWLSEALRRTTTLIDLAKSWRSEPLIGSGRIPKPQADLRITPRP